jgi:hypothetical protein
MIIKGSIEGRNYVKKIPFTITLLFVRRDILFGHRGQQVRSGRSGKQIGVQVFGHALRSGMGI